MKNLIKTLSLLSLTLCLPVVSHADITDRVAGMVFDNPSSHSESFSVFVTPPYRYELQDEDDWIGPPKRHRDDKAVRAAEFDSWLDVPEIRAVLALPPRSVFALVREELFEPNNTSKEVPLCYIGKQSPALALSQDDKVHLYETLAHSLSAPRYFSPGPCSQKAKANALILSVEEFKVENFSSLKPLVVALKAKKARLLKTSAQSERPTAPAKVKRSIPTGSTSA